jgi:hypothetical protein
MSAAQFEVSLQSITRKARAFGYLGRSQPWSTTHMRKFSPVIAAFAFASTFATAEPGPPMPPRIDPAKLLNLDSTRAEKVDAILENAHERIVEARKQIGRPTDETTRATMHAAMEAIRTETDALLAQVLTADELDKLHAAMPRPPRPPMAN